ncbi:MAG: chemotaxis protein CheA [endosymbiont of Galathealinum brachiosum]|uniref:Chemotaxis protein CheA n=1 Tax=endosymbiont of Galathealinum brachiosum TaxID=2200906 RepID=A0A370DJY2_9GAMM|nr:MAG: chemotaxis protein CheA [endosymbiont of Galathealinum brachiosum]
MSIDLEQFHETFYEESFEGLDIMESGLLELEQGEVDLENINTIFRSAHSIKGGSGTFGFTAVAEFTHDMETLLDQMRNGEREVSIPVVNTLLGSVDTLRNMLNAIRDGSEIDVSNVAEMTAAIKGILGEETAAPAAASESQESVTAAKGWIVHFKPHLDIMKTGNDTVRLLRELNSLAESVEVTIDNDALPPLSELDPEDCHQSWCINLIGGDVSEDDIREVFAWVDDECDLKIEALAEEENYIGPERRDTDDDDRRKKEPERRTTERRTGKTAESSSIRVNISKVDELINMVGELVITQSMLSRFGELDNFNDSTLDRLKDGLAQLEGHTRELQESVMRIRMMPISFAFQRFPRLVHDLSATFDKKIELIMTGETTELDKTVLEKIGDPLVHLVRNSLDHGIESPEQRVEAGKSETGVIELSAFHQGGNIVIQIKDDGAGLNTKKILSKAREKGLVSKDDRLTDDQIHDLIFRPGFSTADVVSDVSGRGVGMDVVRRNIRELGGAVEVKSTSGKGSVFTIRLPLTLAILDGQLVGIGEETYILPVISIIESLQVKTENINAVAGNAEVYRLRDEYIPIVRLYQVFGIKPVSTDLDAGLLVVVEAEGKKIAIYVDDLLGQQQVVIKSLETNFRKIEGLSGATILGDGTVALIIDIAGLMDLYQKDMASNVVSIKGAAA